jgi:SulP family sulfate permease
MRPEGVLWFGTAARLQENFLDLMAEGEGLQRLVVHLDGLGRMDITGALALREVLDQARLAGLRIEIVEVPKHWRPRVENIVTAAKDPLGRA